MNENDVDKRTWGYTELYDRALREGHLYPAPSCGSPTLVWHMALAPRRRFGDDRTKLAEVLAQGKPDPDIDDRLKAASKVYDDDFTRFVDELNDLATALQRQGRVSDVRKFDVDALPMDIDPTEETPAPEEGHPRYESRHRFGTAVPQTLTFTVWWSDQPEVFQKTKTPSEDDVRVQVQIRVYTGYASVTFLIDASKPYGQPQLQQAPVVEASLALTRRHRIRRALNVIRSSMTKQMQLGAVDHPRTPEREVSGQEAQDLLTAADFLYKGIWDEFVQTFSLTMFGASPSKSADSEHLKKRLGRRFADMRGHVMSVAGLTTPQDEKRARSAGVLRNKHTVQEIASEEPAVNPERGRSDFDDWEPGYGLTLADADLPTQTVGHAGFGPFDTFDDARNEGHTVLRSLWPFLRRMSPWADQREIVGCGVMSWRALYVSGLGNSLSHPTYSDEAPSRDVDVPANHLPTLERVWGRAIDSATASEEDRALARYREQSRPVRFLIVTKGEPQREQLGRFVSRMMTLETLRFFALRNITTVRNAGVHLELIGRELDGVLRTWSTKRNDVRRSHKKALGKIKERRDRWKRWPTWAARMVSDVPLPQANSDVDEEIARVDYERAESLNDLIAHTEQQAIALAAALDHVGEGGAGRILYLIRRAELAIKDFLELLPTLREGDIDGWTSYSQFVNRGLRSSFAFIELTGQRLVSIRQRLQTVTETIQTAALISEAEATQRNTRTLRSVQLYLMKTRVLGTTLLWAIVVFVMDQVLPEFIRPSKLVRQALEFALDWLWGVVTTAV